MYTIGDRVFVTPFKYLGTIKGKLPSTLYLGEWLYLIEPDENSVISYGCYIRDCYFIPLTAFGEALLGD